MQVQKTIDKFTQKHLEQIDRITNYVHAIKDLFGHLIVRVNRAPLNEYEAIKLPEHVRKSFSFSPLMIPINTFAVDFWIDPSDIKSFELLKCYLDLERLMRKINLEKFIEHKEFIPFLVNNKERAIDFVIAQMYNFLSVVKTNAMAIYTQAVGLFYSMDSELINIEVRQLQETQPYINQITNLNMDSGVMFSHLLVLIAESFYSPKIHNNTRNFYQDYNRD